MSGVTLHPVLASLLRAVPEEIRLGDPLSETEPCCAVQLTVAATAKFEYSGLHGLAGHIFLRYSGERLGLGLHHRDRADERRYKVRGDDTVNEAKIVQVVREFQRRHESAGRENQEERERREMARQRHRDLVDTLSVPEPFEAVFMHTSLGGHAHVRGEGIKLDLYASPNGTIQANLEARQISRDQAERVLRALAEDSDA